MTNTPHGPGDPSSRYLSGISYREMLIDEIIQGLGELRRSVLGLIFSGFSAGLDIGFSMLLMVTALTFMAGEYSDATQHIIVANLYSVGFILVVLGRSELFTEHTALTVFPVLAGRASLRALARLWVIIYAANIAGALVFAALLVTVGPALGATEEHAYEAVARPLLDHPWWLMTLSAVIAGWLMGLLAWLAPAAQDTIGRIFFVWLITTAIGLVPLHHSILGTVEVGSAMFLLDTVGVGDFLSFLSAATVGNIIGGVVFVALVKYGHAVRSEHLEETAEEVLSDEAEGALTGGEGDELREAQREEEEAGYSA